MNRVKNCQNAIVSYEYTMNRVKNYPNATVGYQYTTSPEQTGTKDENKMCQGWLVDLDLSNSIATNHYNPILATINLSFSSATLTKPATQLSTNNSPHISIPLCTTQAAYLARVWCMWDIFCDLLEGI